MRLRGRGAKSGRPALSPSPVPVKRGCTWYLFVDASAPRRVFEQRGEVVVE
jgi:hypothetical protein